MTAGREFEMRLLHVISSLNPESGGTVEGLKQMVSALLRLGHSVEIATLDAPESAWCRMVTVPVHALGPGVLSFRYSAKLAPWLREHVSNYDAVIVEGLWQYHSLASWQALHGGGVPYFVFTHGMLSPWFKKTYPWKHLKKWLYWPWAEYRVLRDAAAVLFTCEEEMRLARLSFWLYCCNEKVAGYGTVSPNGNIELQRNIFLDQHPELREKRLLLFMGRLHEVKGCDILIQAFARVVARNQDLHLVMAGPNPMGWQRELIALSESLGIAGRITWTGAIAGELKWGAYSAAEAFILPSHQENFGMVVAEALACGKPVLISDKVNIWREVEAAGAGIVGTDSVEGTEQILNRWLSLDEVSRQTMRRSARVCFENKFEIERVAQNLINIIADNISST